MTKLFAAVAALCLVLGVYLHIEKSREDALLDGVIKQNSLKQATHRDTILAVNRWVYQNQGFRKNRQYFWIRALGPTQTQILRDGGDCSDKSRLVSGILHRLDIESTLVMLFKCGNCESTHTVVDARYESGWMAVDPVFNIEYPRDAAGQTYYGMLDLRSDPDILVNRVRELGALRGPDDKVNHYPLDTETYTHSRTINTEKNAVTRAVAGVAGEFGIDLSSARRPYLMEDPIGFLRVSAISAGVGILALLALVGLRRRAMWSRK